MAKHRNVFLLHLAKLSAAARSLTGSLQVLHELSIWHVASPPAGYNEYSFLLNRLKKQQRRAWEVSCKQLLGAFSGGGIHHLRRPGAKAFLSVVGRS